MSTTVELIKDNRGKTPRYIIEVDPENKSHDRIRNQFSGKTTPVDVPRPYSRNDLKLALNAAILKERQ